MNIQKLIQNAAIEKSTFYTYERYGSVALCIEVLKIKIVKVLKMSYDTVSFQDFYKKKMYINDLHSF